MKRFLMSFALVCACVAGALEGPSVYKMTEGQLLEVAKSGELDDRMTACQELAHRGTAASVPVLAEMLKSGEPSVFHSALYALQNIPGGEVDAALAAAEEKSPEAKRAAIAHVRAARAGKVFALEKYAGATEALTAFPPKDAIRRGDMSTFPALIEAAAGTGPAAVRVRFQLAGFPGTEIDAKLLELARGADAKKARLAIGTLGDRRARATLPQVLALARTTKDDRLRVETFKALAQMCDVKTDLPLLLDLLAQMPEEDRLEGALVRVGSQAFSLPVKPVNVIEATFGNFKSRQVADVKLMVDSLIEAGSREIMSGCRLVGRGGFHHDPAPGKSKELRIAYSVDGGPVQRQTVPENSILALSEWTMDPAVAKAFVEASLKAKGPARAAFARVLGALEKRGRVPGSDAVLFRPICNGRDLTGWKQDADFFSVNDGVIVGESTPEKPCKGSQYLVYAKEQLADFELRGSFRLSESANSGIQVRSTDSTTKDTGYQADMDGRGNIVGYLFCTGQHLVGKRGCDVVLAAGARKRVTEFADDKELQKVYRVGEWNDIRVVAKGPLLAVWINGVRMATVADSRPEFLPKTGYISIQLHQGRPMKVEFRDLRVRTDEVGFDPAFENALLQSLEEAALGDAPSFEGAEWIWHTAAQNKDGAKVKFRASLDLPSGQIEKAGLVFSCDDSAVFYVNGREVGNQTGEKLWFTPTAVLDATQMNIAPGHNVIEVAAANNHGCAAFIAIVEVEYTDGRILRFPTNARGWVASTDDGKTFVKPQVVCPYGGKPYGKFTTNGK